MHMNFAVLVSISLDANESSRGGIKAAGWSGARYFQENDINIFVHNSIENSLGTFYLYEAPTTNSTIPVLFKSHRLSLINFVCLCTES